MAFIHLMKSKSALHGPVLFMANSGFMLPSFPTMGAWVMYGLGFKAAENPLYSHDLHATALHFPGLDHEKLSYYHNGIQRRLTDTLGHVIREAVA